MLCRIPLAALLLTVVAACADRLAAPLAGQQQARFPERDARRLLEDGFEFIAGRYVDPVPIERVATAGLARIGEMTDEITIRRTGSTVQMALRGQPATVLAAPESRDFFGWADLSARVLRMAWEGSPTLNAKDPDELITALFQGGVSRLDSYSLYLTPRLADEDKASREGFGGIGVRLKTEEGRAFVETVTPHAPAMQAGLSDGDEIIAVDGTPIATLTRTDIPKRLRGPEGSVVTLEMLRPETGQRFSRTITRRFVIAQSVFASLDGDIAILRIETFNAATFDEMTHYLDDLRRTQPRLGGIVLDLRNNPGGHLDQAAAIADYFVESGSLLTQRGRHPSSYRQHEATGRDFTNGIPMAILVNGRSASASEILAAALQDLGRAVVVGSTTFGKGSVQILHELPNRGQLRVTWARMYAPSGYVLDRLGVLPNLCSSNGADDPLESRRGGRHDLTSAFVEWHRYGTVDPMIARAMRQYCPPADATPGADMQLAERVLHDRGLYRSALRPGVGSTLARAVR